MLIAPDRAAVFMHIPRIIDLCADVPIQLVYFALCGHSGTPDTTGTYEDTMWTIRDELFDTVTPDDAREKARLKRISMKMDSSEPVSLKVLSVVANGDPTLMAAMTDNLHVAKRAREDARVSAGEQLAMQQGTDECDEDMPCGDSSDSDDDPFGQIM